MSEHEEKPTLEWVKETLLDLQSYRRKLVNEVKIDVELYNLDFELDIPEGFHEIKSPTTKSICDRLADRLGSGRLQSHREPRSEGEEEQEHVEKLEKADVSLFYLMRRRAKYNPVRAMALHCANRGAFVPKLQVELEGFSKPPGRVAGETMFAHEKRLKRWKMEQLQRFPILLDVRPIEAIFPDPETDGENFVIEHYRRKVGDVMKNYPHWDAWSAQTRDARGRYGKRYSPQTVVEFTEGWTREWRFALVNNEWLPIGDAEPGPVPNLFGRPPYWIRYAGFGDDAGEPHQRCVSLIRAIRTTAKSQSRLLTIVDKLAEDMGYGATVVSAKDEAAKATISYAPGAIIESDAETAADRPTQLRQAIDIRGPLEALGVMQRESERGSVPGEAIGEPSRSRTGQPASGVAAAILTGQASMIVDPVKDAIEGFFSEFFPFVLYVLDVVVEEELSLYGQVGQDSFVNLTLTKNDIDSHYGPVFVELKLRAPEDDYARWNLGIQAMQAGFPPEFVMERFFSVENAAAMVKEMLAKQIAYSAEVRQQYLIPRLIERLQAKALGKADQTPGERVAAPAGFVPPPPPGDLLAGDPMLRAQMGLAPGTTLGQGAPPVVSPGLQA